MRKKITYLGIALLLALSVYQGEAFSQTYYHLYVHNGETGTLKPDAATLSTLAASDSVIWKDSYYNGTTTTVTTYTKTGSTPNLVVSNTASVGVQILAPGLHTFTMTVKSIGACESDPSTAKTIYVLPEITLAFDSAPNPSRNAYCENDATHTSVIKATASASPALPDGIGLKYTWSVQKTVGLVNTTPVVTTVGSPSDTNNGLTAVFTMTTQDVGVYVYRVKAEYEALAGNTGNVKLGSPLAGFDASNTDGSQTKTVTVNPKPQQPTIEVI